MPEFKSEKKSKPLRFLFMFILLGDGLGILQNYWLKPHEVAVCYRLVDLQKWPFHMVQQLRNRYVTTPIPSRCGPCWVTGRTLLLGVFPKERCPMWTLAGPLPHMEHLWRALLWFQARESRTGDEGELVATAGSEKVYKLKHNLLGSLLFSLGALVLLSRVHFPFGFPSSNGCLCF